MATSKKTCFKCECEKPISDFYAHKMMKDGHLNKCKECTKLDVKLRYLDPQKRIMIAEYEKRRFQNPERKKKVATYQKSSRCRNKDKYNARTKVGNLIRSGKLVRKKCEVCGDEKSEAHHTDYNLPTSVRWLCFFCHRKYGHNQNPVISINELKS